MNRDNWLSNKPATRVHHAPGGRSNFSLGWGSQQQSSNTSQSRKGSHDVNKSVELLGKEVVQSSSSFGVHQAAAAAQAPPPKNHCHATAVRNFTRSCGQPTPNTPQVMNRSEVEFITKMVIDELLELNATVMSSNEAKNSIVNMLKAAKDCPQMRSPNKNEIMGEQADALVDIWYYSLNCAAQKGINLSTVFDLVHAANMKKVNPSTGMCIKRADGKIEKPPGWCAPNIAMEIQRQAAHGSFP